ncbi:hypothetical protein JCM3765_007270 [Sporobolomyces pararoseus]
MSVQIPLVSASSLISPPHPTRYFDLLPPEILLLVVEHAASEGNGHHSAYEERQATLRSLCLTSKALKSIAQPILLTVTMLVGRVSRLSSLVENNDPAVLASIKKLSLEFSNRELKREEAEALETLAQNVVQLRELSCAHNWFCMETFLGSNILTLSLFDIYFKSFSFPHLKYLSITMCEFDEEDSQIHLPSLRHLHFIPASQDPSFVTEDLEQLPDLSLCSFTVPLTVQTRSIPNKLTSSASICHTAHADEPPNLSDLVSVKSLFLSCSSPNYWNFVDFDEWSKLIDCTASIKTLILPPLPVSLLGTLINHEEEELLEVCQRRQIKVVREEVSFGGTFWEAVSPWFIKESEKSHGGQSLMEK